MKETIAFIAIHPIDGVFVRKLEFTDEDEEFLEDEEGFDSFSEYVKYYVQCEIDSFNQYGYMSIAAGESEVSYIIESLKA
jgi:hypothetical protein